MEAEEGMQTDIVTIVHEWRWSIARIFSIAFTVMN